MGGLKALGLLALFAISYWLLNFVINLPNPNDPFVQIKFIAILIGITVSIVIVVYRFISLNLWRLFLVFGIPFFVIISLVLFKQAGLYSLANVLILWLSIISIAMFGWVVWVSKIK